MIALPIDTFLDEIVAKLTAHRALVLIAEPGAGKTTRVPPAIVRSGLLAANQHLVMLQPRRLAARAAAERIAVENGWTVGNEVGWHVRFDRMIGPRTPLRVVMEGILVRQLVDDPFLDNVGCVVLDEFHERSIHTDLTLALLRELLENGRDDLRVLVMSATLDASPVAKFLGGCPIVSVPGRTFPVSLEYAAAPTTDPIELRVNDAVLQNFSRSGDLLVFLPGVREIEASLRAISSLASVDVLPLHSNLPFDVQQRALRPSSRKKVILATNIAETSLTIDGVSTVIDSGLARIASFDARRGLDRLDLQRISQASAVQRAGRAGRTAPGHCVRLMTEKEFHALRPFDFPEIQRIDLTPTVLQLRSWGVANLARFEWFEPPSPTAVVQAEKLLEMLGALSAGRLTALGRSMLRFPLHPRLARLMIAGHDRNELLAAATLAALLSEGLREKTHFDPTGVESDVVAAMGTVEQSPQLRRLRDQYLRIADRDPPPPISNKQASEQQWLQMLLLAMPDRVCRRRANDPTHAVKVNGGEVRIDRESVVQHAEYFLALDARQIERGGKLESAVNVASRIEAEWLEAFFPEAIIRETELEFDIEKQRVIGKSIVRYHDLLLRESRDTAVDPKRAGEILAEALANNALAMLEADPAASALLARLDLLRRVMPEYDWPLVDAVSILREWASGKTSVEAMKRNSAVGLITARLSFPFDRLIEQHAPKTIEVPSGSRIAVDYVVNQPPVLAVRLQELFGLSQTPRIAGGRVPVLLHLLGPNYRPVQITDDLESFWKTTYFQVRKDLRVRYPKHSWPDDPLKALPQAKGRHRPPG